MFHHNTMPENDKFEAYESDLLSRFDIEKDYPDVNIPDTPGEVRLRIDELRETIETIEHHLSDPNRTKKSGKRMSSERYRSWRRGAIKALSIKKRDLRACKRWIHAYQTRVTASDLDIDPKSERDLLIVANKVIQSLKNSGADLDDMQLRCADMIRDYVLGVSRALDSGDTET